MKISNLYHLRSVLTIIIFQLPFFTIAQNNDTRQQEIEKLKNERQRIESRIDEIDSRITELEAEIANSILNDSESKGYVCETKTVVASDLRQEASYSGQIIKSVPKRKSVIVLEFGGNSYWKVSYNDQIGFLNEVTLTETHEMKIAKQSFISRETELKQKEQEQAELRKQEFQSIQDQRIRDKYGDFAGAILQGQVQLGMDKEMVIETIGQPDDKNITKGSWGQHEQWVYSKKNTFIYFENGKVTSIQE